VTIGLIEINKMTHLLVGYSNPYLVCEVCKQRVPYWHDPERCGCDVPSFNSPCEHMLGTVSICPTWKPGIGCCCTDKENHDEK
jgi:hypothetical protein